MKHMKKRGFTLLELVVSIAAIAIMSILLSQVFITTIRVNTRNELSNEVKQNGELVLTTMTRMIQNAQDVSSPCNTDGYTDSSLSIVNPDSDTTTFQCIRDATSSGVLRIVPTSTPTPTVTPTPDPNLPTIVATPTKTPTPSPTPKGTPTPYPVVGILRIASSSAQSDFLTSSGVTLTGSDCTTAIQFTCTVLPSNRKSITITFSLAPYGAAVDPATSMVQQFTTTADLRSL